MFDNRASFFTFVLFSDTYSGTPTERFLTRCATGSCFPTPPRLQSRASVYWTSDWRLVLMRKDDLIKLDQLAGWYAGLWFDVWYGVLWLNPNLRSQTLYIRSYSSVVWWHGDLRSESIRLTFRFCLIHMLLLLFCLHSFFLILLFLALGAIVIDINSLLLADWNQRWIPYRMVSVSQREPHHARAGIDLHTMSILHNYR